MMVGTFGPITWGAAVGLMAHCAVNTVQRYLWLYERGTVPRSRQQWRTVCDQVHGNMKTQRQIMLQSGRSDAQNTHQHAAQSIRNTRITRGGKHRAMKTTSCQACDHSSTLLGLITVVKQIHILTVIVKQIHICTTEPSCNYLKTIVAVQLAEVQEYLEFSQLPVKTGNSK